MKNFIDFIADSTQSKELEAEFKNVVDYSTLAEVSNWFQEKGYDISDIECKKIIDNKEEINYQKVGLHY